MSKTAAATLAALCCSLSLMAPLQMASAWAPPAAASSRITTALQAEPTSRRNVVIGGAAAVWGAAMLVVDEKPAHAVAEIDYAKVTDLLGASAANTPEPETYGRSKRPTYLTEPTAEFKENEAKAATFRMEQIRRKKAFQGMLDKLQTDPKDGNTLASDLDDLRNQVKAYGGLPLGITKKDVVTQVRRRKALKFWPTEVEVAYQDLVAEIAKQQSPNTEKDEDNPL